MKEREEKIVHEKLLDRPSITQNYFQIFSEHIGIIYHFNWDLSVIPQLTPHEFHVSLA